MMGTRSNVYVETEPGTYVGTYCHYDGYPSHMFPTLTAIDKDILLTHVLIAAPQGGFRILQERGTEYLSDYSNPCVLENPADEDWGPDYVYIKCYDGGVKWRNTFDGCWRKSYVESVDID